MLKAIRRATLVLLFALQSPALAESNYDQPYLGVWPKSYRRFSAEHLRMQAEQGLAGKVKKADVIVVGAAHNLREVRVSEPVERIQFYEADVKVLRVVKGDWDSRQVHLKFTPSATSIEDGAEHVFLLEARKGQPPTVIEAWYVYPESYNLMRVVGAYNCSKNVGMEVLEHLVSGKHNPTLPSKLIAEYRSDSWGIMYSAVVMAAAASPEIGKDVLVEMVSVKDRKRFAGIKDESSHKAIVSLLSDDKLTQRTEKISDGWSERKERVEVLLKKALSAHTGDSQ